MSPEHTEEPGVHARLGRKLQYCKLTDPLHPDSKKLIEAWRNKQADGGFVMGRDIPSRTLAGLLHSIMVTEPVNDYSDFKIRLAGTALRRRWGREITGLHFSDLFSEETLKTQVEETRRVLETGEPAMMDVKEIEAGVTRFHREAVVLRILAPDKFTHWIMAGVFYFD